MELEVGSIIIGSASKYHVKYTQENIDLDIIYQNTLPLEAHQSLKIIVPVENHA